MARFLFPQPSVASIVNLVNAVKTNFTNSRVDGWRYQCYSGKRVVDYAKGYMDEYSSSNPIPALVTNNSTPLECRC